MLIHWASSLIELHLNSQYQHQLNCKNFLLIHTILTNLNFKMAVITKKMHNYPFNLCCNMARVNRWNSHITISPYSIFDLWHKGQKVILLQYMVTRELIHASSKCYRSFGHPCRQDLVQWRSKSRPLPGRLHAQVEKNQFMLIFNYRYTNIISIQFNPQPPKPLNFIIYLIKKKIISLSSKWRNSSCSYMS